jgi:hypothetical protein
MHPAGSEEILLGKLALAHGLLTREQLDAAVQEQEASKRRLGEVLVERGVISRNDLQVLLAEQERNLQKRHSTTLIRKQDSLFGKVAVGLKLVRTEDANACVREQARLESLGRRVRLGKIMVQNGLLTMEQVGQVLDYQKKQILYCEACDALFNAPKGEAGKTYQCRNCGAALTSPSRVTTCDVQELFQPGDETVIAPGARPGPASPSTKPDETTDPPDADETKPTLIPEPPQEHDDWFLVRDGRPVGPFSYKEMRRHADQGILAPTTFVWRPGMDAWKPAGDLPEVAAVFTSPASETAIVAPPVGAMPEGVHAPALEGFHVTGYLGKRGLGHVFRAKQVAMDREVAIQSLDPELAGKAEFLERLVRDARASARVSHPGIVQRIDMRQLADGWHFVLEFVEGPRVSELLANGGAMAEVRALEVAREVAIALESAHRAGVLHRDLSPEQIQITSDGQAKVADLGLTRRPAHPADGSSGSPPFSAPEARAGKLEPRSDLYSLGATLFAMLTATTPPDRPGMDPRWYNGALHPSTGALVMRLTAREPEARPGSSAEAAREIEAVLHTLAAMRPHISTPGAGPAAQPPGGAPPAAPGQAAPPAGGQAPSRPPHIKRRFRRGR